MFLLVVLVVLFVAGCAPSAGPATAPTDTSNAASTPPIPDVTLQGDADTPTPLGDLLAKKPWTVFLFFTSDCPVQKAHDARFREIVTAYEGKGVTFALISADAGAEASTEREEARKRLLPALYVDKGAVLADALGVEYSTHAVVFDRQRRVLYSGAIDSDKTHMKSASERYLKNALDDAIAGRPIRKAKTEALGCPLRKH